MTPKDLTEFRSRMPDCDLAVFADIRSRTVLASSGDLRHPQEYLDALCGCAADIFGDGSEFHGAAIEHALFFSPTGARAFFRSAQEPTEALCCICAPRVDIAALLARARAALGPTA